MAIIATTNGGGVSTPIEAGTHPARCVTMIHIGTVDDEYQGVAKRLNKVRFTWELPTEMKKWKEDEPEKPQVISKEFTLSMHEKATLRTFLKSWRGKDFTEEQAKGFDVTVLIGVPCMLNIIHKQSKDGTKTYAEIASVSPMMKGLTCPAQINPSKILSYDNFDWDYYETLPDFIKDKMTGTDEFKAMNAPHATEAASTEDDGDIPF